MWRPAETVGSGLPALVTNARRIGRVGLLAAVTLPLMVACPEVSNVAGGKTPAHSPKSAASPTPSRTPSGGGSAGVSSSATPTPAGSGTPTTTGGLDQNTSKVPTATPLSDATSVPTEIPRSMGETDGTAIVYGGTLAQIFFAAGGRGYVAVAGEDQLGEFPSVSPGGSAIVSPAGVVGLQAAGPDGAGGAWVAGATSRTLLHLTGAALTAGTPIALSFTPALLASDAQRVWLAGSAGEGLAVTAGATAAFSFSEVPAYLATDGKGGVWAADGSASGGIRLYSSPDVAPSAPASLGGQVAGLATGDSGGVWAIVQGATPRLVHHTTGGDKSVALTAGEVPHGVAGGGATKAWVLTDKALYQIETLPSEALKATRYPRTETWVPGALSSDPVDRRKIYAIDPAGKAVRRLYTGS